MDDKILLYELDLRNISCLVKTKTMVNSGSLVEGFLKMKKEGNFMQVFFCFVNSVMSLINLMLNSKAHA